MKRIALVSLAVGLFGLRAALTHPPSGQLQGSCPNGTDQVTWNADLTLDFYQSCDLVYADHAAAIFLIVVACSTICTLYGCFVLFPADKRRAVFGR